MSEITCEIRPTKPMHLAVDPGDRRPALGGVAVEPLTEKTVVCAATNGRILAIVKEEGTATMPTIAPSDAFKVKKGEDAAIVKNGRWERHSWKIKRGIRSDQTIAAFGDVEGRFPRFRDVLPNIDEGQTVAVTIDAALLLDLANALGRNDERRGITLFLPVHQPADGKPLTYGESEGAIACVVEGGGIGALMPLDSREGRNLPPSHASQRAEYSNFVKSIAPKPAPAV